MSTEAITVEELAILKAEFERSLAESIGTRLANFREATNGSAIVSDIVFTSVQIIDRFPGRVVDQAVVDVTCTLSLIDAQGRHHEL